MLSFPPFSSLTLQPHLQPPQPFLLILLWNLPLLLPNFHPLPSHYSCHPTSTLVVNNSNELGPVEELALLANETSVTLPNLKYSTRYKFYLNAKTVRGAGPAISQETVTIMDEGKSTNADNLKENNLILDVSSARKLDEYLNWLISFLYNSGKSIQLCINLQIMFDLHWRPCKMRAHQTTLQHTILYSVFSTLLPLSGCLMG